MSSLYSDPAFTRGSTLLGLSATDVVTTDSVGIVEGRAVVGQVKIFQDVNPTTKQILSDRLVYCVAARYKGSSALDATANAGSVYLFDPASPLDTFGNTGGALASTTNLTNSAQMFGVLDEYLTGTVQTNDVVWLVVKGPTSAKQTASAIGAGAVVGSSGTAGSVAAFSTGAVLGTQLVGASKSDSGTLCRINLANSYV